MLGALPLAVALLVAVAVAPLTSALYSRGDDVVELTAKNFQSRVLDSPDVWLVEFYAPCRKNV